MTNNSKYFNQRATSPDDGPWKLIRSKHLGLILVRTLGTHGDVWEMISVDADNGVLDCYGG